MAQDNYHRYGSQDSAYDSHDHHDDPIHRKSQAYHTVDSAMSQGYSRPRASTDDSHSSNDQPQPRAHAPPSSASHLPSQGDSQPQVNPELVAQITQQVLQSLKINGLATSIPPPPAQIPILPQPTHSYTTIPPPSAYSPPSPGRNAGPNVNPPLSDVDGYQLDGNKEKEMPSVRFAERSGTPPQATKREHSRPRAPPRQSTGDATTLEKIWRPLFDADGEPTARLGQFLRGLALHIIADFEPEQSMVITPSKMLKFYETVKVPNEIYPWQTIFGGKMTHSSLSHLYRDLKCQHFFIQVNHKDKPSVPALTPVGFECWMTHLIRAHPELEYKRFSEAVLHMPISNGDDLKERFPKELSRRLFPGRADEKIQMDFEDAILADPIVQLLREASAASVTTAGSTSNHPQKPVSSASACQPHQEQGPAPSPPKSKATQPRPSSVERERKPYSGSSSDVAVEEGSASIAIERERKPYYSQPGGGKVYESDDGSKSNKADGPRARSNSTVMGSVPTFNVPQDEYSGSKSGRSHRQGSTVGTNQPGWKRNRSPEHSSVYTRSEGDMAPLSTYSSNASQDTDDETRRYQRRYGSEDNPPRTYPASSTKGNAYEDDGRYGRRGSVQTGGSNIGGYGGYPPPPARY